MSGSEWSKTGIEGFSSTNYTLEAGQCNAIP